MRTPFSHVVFSILLLAGCSSRSTSKTTQQTDGLLAIDLPSLHYASYRVDPYIQAVVGLQALDRKTAAEQLLRVARDREHGDRVVPLCRMLFVARRGFDFRSARLGYAEPLGSTTNSLCWPLEPIEVVDGVPFLIILGYRLGGEAETGESYVEYCLSECEWSSERFALRSAIEKREALRKLLESPKWSDRSELKVIERILSKQIE
jgi:hypothetical protein